MKWLPGYVIKRVENKVNKQDKLKKITMLSRLINRSTYYEARDTRSVENG